MNRTAQRLLLRDSMVMPRFRPAIAIFSQSNGRHGAGAPRMTEFEIARTLDELDRLINDPSVPMQPERIWTLLAEVSHRYPGRAAPIGQPAR